jgi:transcriptional regulator with XRE-family HTH domain
MSDKVDTIEDRLKAARKWSGLSQARVSELLDMRRPSISELEAGTRNLSATEAHAFASLYKVSTDWLLSGSTNDGIDERVKMVARSLATLKDDDLKKISLIIKALESDPND